MIRSSRSAVALGVGAVGWTLVLTGAVAQSPEARPSIAALQMDRPITLDGVLDESIWGEAEIGSDFTRREPEDRVPASERTEFSVLYTRDTLYFGIRAYDSNADGIIAKEMERDSRLDGDDSIAIVLDTFRDRRNAYVFEINPNGARKDLLVTDEGSNLNVEWNGVWSVATHRGEEGWTAEIAIPFSTLRFDRRLDAWGLNVRRLIRRKNEEVNWAALGREIYSDPFFAVYAAYRVSLAGELTGLEALRPSRQFDVKPFFVGTATEAPADLLGKVQTDADAGVDIKWGVTRSLALDLTYNTDFAEVEVDEQQINLTRFSLFFPEKREFFLENAGIFDFGAPRRENFDPALLKVFFSRRIGLDDGEEVPLDWGGRLTGRIGGWNIGVLSTTTEGVDERQISETEWSVVRVKRNIGRRSSLGAIYTDRSPQGSGSNRVFGYDFDYKPSDKLAIRLFHTWSEDSATENDDNDTFGAGVGYTSRDVSWSYDFQEVQENYDPSVGFLLRRNFTRHNPRFTYLPQINRWGIRAWYFGGALDYFERSSDGALESRKLEIWPVGMQTLKGAHRWRGAVSFETERLFEPFEIQPGVVIPAGLYRFEGWNIGGRSNQSRPLWVSGQAGGGEFFDGHSRNLRLTLNVRGSRHFRMATTVGLNDVELPAGDFTTHLYSQRFDVSFSPDLRLNTLVQYNDANDFIGLNIRFNWTYRPNSDLFVVYNHNWDAMGFSSRATRVKQLIVKLTYLFQL